MTSFGVFMGWIVGTVGSGFTGMIVAPHAGYNITFPVVFGSAVVLAMLFGSIGLVIEERG